MGRVFFIIILIYIKQLYFQDNIKYIINDIGYINLDISESRETILDEMKDCNTLAFLNSDIFYLNRSIYNGKILCRKYCENKQINYDNNILGDTLEYYNLRINDQGQLMFNETILPDYNSFTDSINSIRNMFLHDKMSTPVFNLYWSAQSSVAYRVKLIVMLDSLLKTVSDSILNRDCIDMNLSIFPSKKCRYYLGFIDLIPPPERLSKASQDVEPLL